MSSDPDPRDQLWIERSYEYSIALNWTHRFVKTPTLKTHEDQN
jgi:hypothetical protein